MVDWLVKAKNDFPGAWLPRRGRWPLGPGRDGAWEKQQRLPILADKKCRW
jgi:hypothetical protein